MSQTPKFYQMLLLRQKQHFSSAWNAYYHQPDLNMKDMTKPTKWLMRPANSLISLDVRPVWSESSLCAHWVSSCGQRRLRSGCADARADLSLRWAHRSFCWFCHAAADILKDMIKLVSMLMFSSICNKPDCPCENFLLICIRLVHLRCCKKSIFFFFFFFGVLDP